MVEYFFLKHFVYLRSSIIRGHKRAGSNKCFWDFSGKWFSRALWKQKKDAGFFPGRAWPRPPASSLLGAAPAAGVITLQGMIALENALNVEQTTVKIVSDETEGCCFASRFPAKIEYPFRRNGKKAFLYGVPLRPSQSFAGFWFPWRLTCISWGKVKPASGIRC